jgi:hypothetical protein
VAIPRAQITSGSKSSTYLGGVKRTSGIPSFSYVLTT